MYLCQTSQRGAYFSRELKDSKLEEAEIIPKEPGQVMLPRDINRNPL